MDLTNLFDLDQKREVVFNLTEVMAIFLSMFRSIFYRIRHT